MNVNSTKKESSKKESSKNESSKREFFDYKELGFKCGIEIHQQLAGKKLFCNCPCKIRKDEPDFLILRRLRASAGESGRVDRAALHEQQKSKLFEYQGYNDTTCLVELDEEPPHPVNMESVETALVAAKLLNMKIVDCIQFMRKTVIDGSNTSGFQRTALIGYDGYVEVNDKKIRIDTLCLEEEACQVISRKEDKDIYNLSRLGIPLLEIATAPDIESPEECKEVAAYLGMLLRSTGKVLRGLGTIRQDVNVSIKNGARTEIKGFQDVRSIPEVINNEIKRHLSLLNEGQKPQPEVRKAEMDMTTSFLRPMPGADRMYPETDIDIIEPKHLHIKKPLTLKEREHKYETEYGLSKDLASLAVRFESKNEEGYMFEEDFKKYCSGVNSLNESSMLNGLSPSIIVDALLIKAIDAEKKSASTFDVFKFKDELFSAIVAGNIAASAIPEIFLDIISNGEFDKEKFKQLDDSLIEKTIDEIISENPGANKGLIMGKIMTALKGRADGKKVMSLVNIRLK